jgi:hypothetical protein
MKTLSKIIKQKKQMVMQLKKYKTFTSLTTLMLFQQADQ